MKHLWTSLRFLPACAVPFVLTSCPAPPFPLVGYHTTDKTDAPRVLCTTHDTSKAEELTLYEQTTHHNYDLLLTPEGDQHDYPLKKSFAYLGKVGTQDPQPLGFLFISNRFTPTMIHETSFEKVFTIIPGKQWVACARTFYGSAYDVRVFTMKRQLLRKKVEVAEKAPCPEYLPASGELRYLAPDGWKTVRL